jgi:TPR repeat protein
MLRLANFSITESKEEAEWLQKAADAGDPDAAAELGQRLKDVDPTTALRYLLLAAGENRPTAQYNLGVAYLEGKGCAQDPLAAIGWLTEAMKSGDAESQYKLGTLHEQGIGGPVNYANAGVLYTMACGKGHAGAAARIAQMAAEGLGTIRNPGQAWAHAVLAKERGDNSADGLRATLEQELTASEKTEGEKTLTDLRAKIPAQGAKQ